METMTMHGPERDEVWDDLYTEAVCEDRKLWQRRSEGLPGALFSQIIKTSIHILIGFVLLALALGLLMQICGIDIKNMAS